jgi:hypothetical protein
MKRLPTILALLTILVLPLAFSYYSVNPEDCFVQIISVTLNQSSLEVGERLQVDIVYDLYYDPTDPLGIGSVSVSFAIQGSPISLSSFEFTTTGFDINETVTFDISPIDWTPNATGQIGVVQVESWVQDSIGTMTDSVQQQFTVERSILLISIDPVPFQITFHENFNIEGALNNPHNSSLLVSNHPIEITVLQNNLTLQSWNSQTTPTNNFTQPINSTSLGAGDFECRITALSSNDYNTSNSNVSFSIINANLTFSVSTNVSTVHTYYPSTNNCSLLVSAHLDCEAKTHELSQANVTCSLGNMSQNLDYIDSNFFSTEVFVPPFPGNYSLFVEALLTNHNPINASIPVKVVLRQAQITLTSNCSEAAYDEIIELTINAVDRSSQIPIKDKICSLYLYNQSTWNLLAQSTLDHTGCAQFLWQAQNVGNEDYKFKVILEGYPEFSDAETEVLVTNTRDLRFIGNTTLHIIRPDDVNYTLQLTTLDYQPLFNVSVYLIEIATNSTWSTALTNLSGYAILSWSIAGDFLLGPHEFYLRVQDGLTTLGTIPITMIIYEQTVLELV